TTIYPPTITFTLLDDNGNVIDSITPGRYRDGIHRSLFYNDIFNRRPSGTPVIRSLRITSDNPIAIIAVQVAGETLTTFPVVALSRITSAAGGAAGLDLGGLLQKRHADLTVNTPAME